MNFEYFFAKRITFNSQRAVSGLVVRLAIISIALAVATIEISLSFVQGFETEIQNKVIGFGSHIQIGNYYRELDTEATPLPKNEPSIKAISTLPYVKSIAPYVERMGVCQSEDGWEGIVLKGVDSEYPWDFFEATLIDGKIPNFEDQAEESKQILISKKQSQLLELNVGDKARLIFWPQPFRRRQVEIVGIYETGMEEFDNYIMICDIRLLQKIWRWSENEVSGFEVNLTSLDHLEEATFEIDAQIPYLFGAEPITYLFPEIFDWLELQHQNVWFILILMMIVAVINMTSVVLILVIERTKTIGVLKSMGLPGYRVRKLFVWNAFFLISFGVLAGNILGLGLLASQDAFGWLQVNQSDYFIKVVPVAWVWGRFLMANLGVIVLCTVFMFIPTIIINRISPLAAIRFE